MPPVSGSAYDKSFQQQLLAHLRWEEELILDALRVMTVDDFELPIMRITYEAIRNCYVLYRKLPTHQELDDEIVKLIHNVNGEAESAINPEEYEALFNLRNYIGGMSDPRLRNLQRFKNELRHYITWVRQTRLIGPGVQHIYRGGAAAPLAQQIIEIDRDVASKLEADTALSVYSQNTGIMMSPEEADIKISTGTPKLDKKMDGGLGIGELGMITACPGLGKTNTLINFSAGANFIRQHSLLVSLELQERLIKRRYTAIAGCILGKTVKSLHTLWNQEDKKRLQLLLDEDFAAHDLFTVSDRAGKTITVDMLDREIDMWREGVARRWGDDAVRDCTSVCVDWADLLHLRNENKNEAEHLRLKKIMTELKALAVRKEVALWTATQGTKEADGKAVLHMRHVSYGYHKNDALDIGIGLGLSMTDQQAQAFAAQMEGEGNAPDIDDNGRNLIFNFNKNRNASIGPVNVYQAPTLRFYNNEAVYRHHTKELSATTSPQAALAAGHFRMKEEQ